MDVHQKLDARKAFKLRIHESNGKKKFNKTPTQN